MRLITYRLVVTAPDSLAPDLLVRYVEDALEGLSREDGIESRYVQIGTAEGLPDKAPEERCTHGAGVVCPEADSVV